MILNKKYLILAGFGVLALAFVTSQDVLASIPGEDVLPGKGLIKEGGTFEESVRDTIIPRITNLVYVISLMIAVMSVIWGGYQLLMSQGESEQVNSAKSIITWSIVGVITIILANSIIQLILSTNFTEGVAEEAAKEQSVQAAAEAAAKKKADKAAAE